MTTLEEKAKKLTRAELEALDLKVVGKTATEEEEVLYTIAALGLDELRARTRVARSRGTLTDPTDPHAEID